METILIVLIIALFIIYFTNLNRNVEGYNPLFEPPQPLTNTITHPEAAEVSDLQGEGQHKYPITHSFKAFPLLRDEYGHVVDPNIPKQLPFSPNLTDKPAGLQYHPGNPPYGNHLDPLYKIRDNEIGMYKELDTNLILPNGMRNPDLTDLKNEFSPEILYRPTLRSW